MKDFNVKHIKRIQTWSLNHFNWIIYSIQFFPWNEVTNWFFSTATSLHLRQDLAHLFVNQCYIHNVWNHCNSVVFFNSSLFYACFYNGCKYYDSNEYVQTINCRGRRRPVHSDKYNFTSKASSQNVTWCDRFIFSFNRSWRYAAKHY